MCAAMGVSRLYRAGPKGTNTKRRHTSVVGIYSACALCTRAIAAASRRTPGYNFELLAPTERHLLSGRTAPFWALSPCVPSAVHDGLDGLQLNPGIALEPANAKAGKNYQLPVHGHQPRAPGTPVQALQVPSTHAAIPRERMIEVHGVRVKEMVWCLSS